MDENAALLKTLKDDIEMRGSVNIIKGGIFHQVINSLLEQPQGGEASEGEAVELLRSVMQRVRDEGALFRGSVAFKEFEKRAAALKATRPTAPQGEEQPERCEHQWKPKYYKDADGWFNTCSLCGTIKQGVVDGTGTAPKEGE